MATQTLFITGGSGYIGSTIIKYALLENYTIRALSRTPASDEKIMQAGATPVRGDLESHSVLTAEASKADVVINIADVLAGSFGKITMDERYEKNLAAVDALGEGMKSSGKPLILTSGSLLKAPHPDGEETDESSPGWPKDHPFYTEMYEKALLWKDHGVRTCSIALAPYVFGRGGSGVALFMGMWFQAGGGVYIDEGTAKTTTVHVDDAARLYLLAAKKGRAGELYNATWETDVSQGDLAKTICKQVDIPCHSISTEAANEKMGPWFTAFLGSANRASNRKAKEELGWDIRAEKGILEEIKTGSYVEVAEKLTAAKEDKTGGDFAYTPRAEK